MLLNHLFHDFLKVKLIMKIISWDNPLDEYFSYTPRILRNLSEKLPIK